VVSQQNADIANILQPFLAFNGLILGVSFWGEAISWKHSQHRRSDGRCHGNHFWLCICGVHIGATWRIWLNCPRAAAMRPYVKLQWSLVTVCETPR